MNELVTIWEAEVSVSGMPPAMNATHLEHLFIFAPP